MGMLPTKMKTMVLSVLVAITHGVTASPLVAPSLSNDSDYSEYWEQQFLFDNNTVATSQFLIANLPFSRHHGMMVATLKEADADTVIIKNGRKRSGWNFSADQPQLSIFQHNLSGDTPGFQLRLHNTAAELDVDFTAGGKAVTLVGAGNKLGLPEVNLYAPSARAIGRWRDGPEIGGLGPDGAWQPIGDGFGYGLHVVQNKAPNAAMKRWWRFTAGGSNGRYEPVLHAFETPKGGLHFAMLLFSASTDPIRFDVNDFQISEDGKSWKINATAGTKTLTGTMMLGNLLESFNLKDQLNGLEKLAAGSMADVSRLRYAATYRLELNERETITILDGMALAEDIQMGAQKAKRRRSRR